PERPGSPPACGLCRTPGAVCFPAGLLATQFTGSVRHKPEAPARGNACPGAGASGLCQPLHPEEKRSSRQTCLAGARAIHQLPRPGPLLAPAPRPTPRSLAQAMPRLLATLTAAALVLVALPPTPAGDVGSLKPVNLDKVNTDADEDDPFITP